ncbi:MAG: Hsp70 family protein [Akkermansia sp.]|nr:Hsp70 family protein [Akkermansia sp.]
MSENTKPMVYGIDLGTTYSAISYMDESNNATIINNPDGGQITASAVYFEEGNYIVGDTAKESASIDPDNFVSLIKREIGSTWRKKFFDNEHSPESISALILKYMVKGAEKEGHSVKDVVITCPAYFNEAERAATKAAGEIAGLNVLAVVDEPIAAAISYGLGMAAQLKDGEGDSSTKQVIVYDLGGGTFDVTVVKVAPDGVQVVCSDGDHQLGGADWDNALRDVLLEKLNLDNPEAGDPMSDPETAAALLLTVEKTKKSLSQRETAKATISCPDGKVKVSVTREEFEEATRPLLERTISFTDDMIAKARAIAKDNGGSEKIDEFLLVGGSTYMPQIMAMVESRYKDSLGVAPKLYEPNYAVSKGAAAYGNIKAIQEAFTKIIEEIRDTNPTKTEDEIKRAAEQAVADGFRLPVTTVTETINTTVRTVASKSIGIRVLNKEKKPVCFNLIKKQTPVPCCKSQQFPVSEANATTLPLVVYSNNMDEIATELDYCGELGKAEMALTPGLPAGAIIEVTFSLDENGRLELTARDITNNKKINHEFTVTGALTKEDLEEKKKIVAELEMAEV